MAQKTHVQNLEWLTELRSNQLAEANTTIAKHEKTIKKARLRLIIYQLEVGILAGLLILR